MDPAALSLGRIWREALEFTQLVLMLSAMGDAPGSLLLLGFTGLGTECISRPRVSAASCHAPFHLPQVSKLQ